jgi:hypothetical protein
MRFVVALFAAGTLASASTALAAPRMPLGFQDDPTFRWSPLAADAVSKAGAAHATIIRTIADWRAIAPQRPARPANAFDPAYRLNDLDDLARNAQRQGIMLLITIWGTPPWANGGKGPNVAPTNPADLRDFAHAVADRYSGRHAGYPYVGRYSIWNEPNLQIFLTPQFDRRGRIVSPHTYATLFRSGDAGIRMGNPTALVAIGETSNQGRDHPLRGGIADSVAPGTFARLLANEPALRFDAFATHPYPTHPSAPPTQKVRWPNVTLSQLPRLETSLDRWFRRRDIPVWITEYGYQTTPASRFGVTESEQARYLSLTMRELRADLRVQLFVWFVFRDSDQSVWRSGLRTLSGHAKPSYATFTSFARSMSGQTAVIRPYVKPIIELPVPRLAFGNPVGTTVGINYRVYRGSTIIAIGQPAPRLETRQLVRFVADFAPAPGQEYTLTMDAGDINGNHVLTSYTLLTSK